MTITPGLEKQVQTSRTALLDHYRAVNRGMKPEDMFAVPIKDGLLKIVRRRGKPPAIIWL